MQLTTRHYLYHLTKPFLLVRRSQTGLFLKLAMNAVVRNIVGYGH